jgi:outer membrane lipase/esterase
MGRRLIRQLSCIAGLALAAAVASPAWAYSKLVVFGDSLSDSGNNALAIGTAPDQVITGNGYVPTFPYASGTYSDGPVWASSFAAGLGLELMPSLAGGSNYAFGGARTSGGTAPSLASQVTSFLGDTGGAAPGDALYVLAGGGNNARDAFAAIALDGAPLGRTLLANALTYARDLRQMVGQLQAAGAADIVVWNVPNLGLAPAVAAFGAEASFVGQLVSNTMNNALARQLGGIGGVRILDINGLFAGVVANPGAYGLANVTDACGAIAGCDPWTYLFWDGIHPTSAGHALLADAMTVAVAIPEPGVVWMFAAGLGVVLLVRRRRRV